MEEGRSVLGVFVGFFFWFGVAYYFYHRDFIGAFWFAVASGLLYGVYLWFRHLWAARPRPLHIQDEDVDLPSRSDLPNYDFENAKPKDFE